MNKFSLPKLTDLLFVEEMPNHLNDDECLVIYAKSSKPTSYICNAYIRASDIIIDKLNKNGISAGEDELAAPLLNLYINSIELALKYLIEHLIQHQEEKTCFTIGTITHEDRQMLSSHDVDKLSKLAKRIIPKKGDLHHLEHLSDICTFFSEIYNAGITSESTRYHKNKTGILLELHGKQLYIKIIEFHNSVKNACNYITQYVESDDFHLCSRGEYKKGRIDELMYAKKIMKSKQNIFNEYMVSYNKINQNKKEKGFRPFSAKDGLLYRKKQMLNRILSEKLKNMNQKELAVLVMGLYFIRPPIQIENHEYFSSWTRDRLIIKILERAIFFNEAYKNIEKYIFVLQNKKKIKGVPK